VIRGPTGKDVVTEPALTHIVGVSLAQRKDHIAGVADRGGA
jgi:hypothetical protein